MISSFSWIRHWRNGPTDQSVTGLADVDAVEIVGAEGSVALWALSLACVVTRLHALEAEDVEALCQHSILYTRVAARTRQTGLQEQDAFIFLKGYSG